MLPVITNASKVLLVGFVFLGLSCIATLMYSFMGGSDGGPDARALVALQRSGIVVGALTIVFCLARSIRDSGRRNGLRLLWRHLPGWLVFAGGLMLSLAVMGEVAWVVIRYSADGLVGSFNHVSLICLGSSTLAFMLLFATVHRLRGHAEFSKARW